LTFFSRCISISIQVNVSWRYFCEAWLNGGRGDA
jgi:hypothetical protein